jgi:hypothetical protein
MTTTPANPFNPGVQVGNSSLPPEGPRALPYRLDFSAQQAYAISCNYIFQQKLLSNIQSVFVDNSGSLTPLTLLVNNTQQQEIIPPGAQAYLPLLMANSATLVVSSTGGVPVFIQLLNIPMPACVWYPNQPAQFNLYDVNGNLKTADQGLAPIITPAGLKVAGLGATTSQYVRLQTQGTGGNDVGLIPAVAGKTVVMTHLEVNVTGDATLAAAGDVTIFLTEPFTLTYRPWEAVIAFNTTPAPNHGPLNVLCSISGVAVSPNNGVNTPFNFHTDGANLNNGFYDIQAYFYYV